MVELRRRSRGVKLDPEAVKGLMKWRGLSQSQLCEDADIALHTIRRVLRGGHNANHSTATNIADALGLSDYRALLSPCELEPVDRKYGPVGEEWIAEAMTPFQQTSNGLLQFRLCRMAHQHIPGRLGRGKWYELLHESQEQRQRLRDHLTRHPVVCERLGHHPNIAENLSTSTGPNECEWWVIDRHVEGQSLDTLIADETCPTKLLPRLMKDLATGLDALHRASIVFRELAPSRIVIAESDGRAVMTDFELAKLLEPAPTVSADWPDDPYRAPEVETGVTDGRADLYSWARILLHSATGSLPEKGCDFDAISQAPIPKSVWRIAADCLAPAPDDRPSNISKVLRAIRSWKS